MKRNNGGFSLVEVVVAMAILGIFATASCTCLVLAHDMNGKTDGILQSRLAVSSAVETLMAEGIKVEGFIAEETSYNPDTIEDNVSITIKQASKPVKDDAGEVVKDQTTGKDVVTPLPYYDVTVTSSDNSIEIKTQVRKAYVAPPEDETDTEVANDET